MGFGKKWITWIMECVRTASMSILVNGSPTSPFHLQRGLRQGDPLSPFLFLIVAETFSRLVSRGRELGVLDGVTVGENQIPITHLQFADDTIIFAPDDMRILGNYKKLLQCFELLSGLKINFEKSVLIPINCGDEWSVQAAFDLECGVSSLPINYLGIPLGANPRRLQTWKPIVDKIEKRLSLWKARALSKAGRLVLIKAVLNNLPMYYLSLFRMPKKVAERIIQLQRRFFWGKLDGERGGYLVSWEVIQKPKDLGGLGVGDIHVKNAALLFKWWWRFADSQKPLWKEIVCSNHNIRHFGDLQEVSERNQGSIWGQLTNFRSFRNEIQEVARKGIQIKVGNGAQTRFWHDRWIEGETLKELFPRLYMLSNQKDNMIKDMGAWENEKWKWIFRWRRNLFSWEEELVGNLYLVVNRLELRENTRDERVWAFNNSLGFFVSNFVLQVTKSLENANTTMSQNSLAWKNSAPPRAQLLVWFILQGRLNTKDRLIRLGIPRIDDDRCIFCKEEPETLEHVFFSCRISSGIWYYCCAQWNLSMCLPKDSMACFLSWLGTPLHKANKKVWISLFFFISCLIWDIRNKMIFQGFVPDWELEKKKLIWRLRLWTRCWHPNSHFPTEILGEG